MFGLIFLLQALTVAVSGPATSPEYLSLHVADAQGYFAREGLSVTLKTTRSETAAAEALAQGDADLAATSLEALLRVGPHEGRLAPRLIFGLTAAPPVALLVPVGRARPVRSVVDLTGGRVGLASPGAPEHAWLSALLSRAKLSPTQLSLVSLSGRGVATAVEAGQVDAGLVAEPLATRLIADGRATLLADFRTPAAVIQALGVPTLNAAVFVRKDRRPANADLAGLVRALLAAERLIATASPDALAAALSKSVVGTPSDFEARVETTRRMYLADGVVSLAQLRETVALIRAYLPLSPVLRVPRAEDLLDPEPLRRALNSPRRG